MTVGYYKGKRIIAQPKTKAKTRQRLSEDVINQDEVKYNQLQNKIANDKIDDIYYSSMEKLNEMEGEILEKIAKNINDMLSIQHLMTRIITNEKHYIFRFKE